MLAEKASPETKVLVLERDPDFCVLLRERFSALHHFDVIEGDVRDLAAMLADRGIARADYVISGLPVPVLPQGPSTRPVPGRAPGARPGGHL